MRVALPEWSPEELRHLATLFHRRVGDFLAHEGPRGAGAAAAVGREGPSAGVSRVRWEASAV
ncbi:hypothetical protein [Streptomyces sp. NPDC085932]|uniref:hypothetical protein n=1 Tax=Streptomyces sp. NPDC085932 TaxID=3365741 RepID=UPI0037D318C8